MNTNKEFLTKMIRVSPSVKKRMEIFQGGDSANSCIDRMITFFETQDSTPLRIPESDGIGGKEN